MARISVRLRCLPGAEFWQSPCRFNRLIGLVADPPHQAVAYCFFSSGFSSLPVGVRGRGVVRTTTRDGTL